MEGDKKITVLVVDDDPTNVKLLDGILVAAGFEVLAAADGNECTRLVKEKHPDLILLDIVMPELDGFQTCDVLRKDPSTASIPIMMVTARDSDCDIVQSLEKGADDYVVKPVDRKDLLQKIDILLSKAKTGKLPSHFYFKKLKSEGDKI